MTESLVDPYKYWAFISYSSNDRATVVWLTKKIEGYRVPSTLIGLSTKSGPVPKRLYPIFRDRDELRTGSDLKTALDEALRSSKFLIVVCSPNSAVDSSWVNEEIKYFKTLPQGDNILAIIVAGEPNATLRGEAEIECFPPALRRSVDLSGDNTTVPPEPLAADLSREDQNKRVSRRKALLKVIARMIDVNFDDLERRDLRRRRQRMLIGAVSLFLVLALIGAAVARWYLESIDNSAKTMARQAKQLSRNDPEFAALLSLRSFALSPNAAAYDSLITVATSNQNFHAVAIRGERVEAAGLDANDQFIVAASCADQACEKHELTLSNLRGMDPVGRPVRLDADSVVSVDFHPGQPGFYVTANLGDRDSIYYFEYDAQGIVSGPDTYWAHNNRISHFAISASSGSVAVAYGKWKGHFKYGEWVGQFSYAKVQVLDAKKVPVCTQEFRAPVEMSAFSAAGDYLSVVVDSRVHVIDVRRCTQLSPQGFAMHRSGAVAFDPTSGDLYSVALDGVFYQLGIEQQTSARVGAPSKYSHLDYHHRMDVNANYLASKDGASIYLYNTRHYRDLQGAVLDMREQESPYAYIAERDLNAYRGAQLRGGEIELLSYGFSPSGKTLYTIDKEGTVYVWRSEPYSISEMTSVPDQSWICSDTTCEGKGGRELTTVAEDSGRKFVATLTTTLTECGGDKKNDCLLVSELSVDDLASGLNVHTLVYEERTPPRWDRLAKLEFDSDGKLLVGDGFSVRVFHFDLSSLRQRVCTMAGNQHRIGETDQHLDTPFRALIPYIQGNSKFCH